MADKTLGTYPRRNPLTAREIEIIQLLAEGKPNRQIAQELGVSVRTVEGHRAHLKQKLACRSLVDLIYYAIDHGIVSRREAPVAHLFEEANRLS